MKLQEAISLYGNLYVKIREITPYLIRFSGSNGDIHTEAWISLDQIDKTYYSHENVLVKDVLNNKDFNIQINDRTGETIFQR